MAHLVNDEEIAREVRFKTSRSSGKGGQNVNKVATRAEAYLDIPDSSCFTPGQKELLLEKLASRISHAGILQVTSEEERSQLMNKEKALKKMLALLKKALRPVKPRKATKPSRASVEKRLQEKTLRSIKKETRRKPSPGKE
ncbi:MAG TPA: alternative ribosome rescue aminoacyl-tRNA hydrolase ArfB [Anseongella sp.]|nr:alternative ribosome rescue aminoacyl-tRNA hydrolase ArfB [Anseongella sp.]